MIVSLLLFLTFGISTEMSSARQMPLFFSSSHTYDFHWPIRKVAIIGAGPSGLVAYREFIREGFEVHIFERDSVPGGNWHYTEETPVDAPVPNANIMIGDYVPSFPPPGEPLPYEEQYDDRESHISYAMLRREHRAPKPLWESLKSNAPAAWQQFPEHPWPIGTPWELTQHQLCKYMRSFASFYGINSNDESSNVSYNTRVELVEKWYNDDGHHQGWRLTLKALTRTGDHTSKAVWWSQNFDAVVVASGRFNAPYIPPIAGLTEWVRSPGRILHSRQYRRPQSYEGETILIVGAATSGSEIARDLDPYAKKIYQSIKPDNATVPHYQLGDFLRRLPSNVTVVPEIKRFHSLPGLEIDDGLVELANGTFLTGIDRVIFATGFRYTFPFLPQYHNSSVGANDTAPVGQPQPIVTDGTHVRSLYLDLFYIEEPTLGFLSMNLGILHFNYPEYLSLALAKVWGNKAKLPETQEMWRLYRESIQARGGHGKHLQFLGKARNDEMSRFFVSWLNDAAVKYGGRQIDGQPQENEEILKYWAIARFGNNIFLDGNGTLGSDNFLTSCHGNCVFGSEQKQKDKIWDIVFNHFW